MVIAGEDHSRGNDGARQWTTPGFIDPCNKRKASSTKSVLVLEAAIHRR